MEGFKQTLMGKFQVQASLKDFKDLIQEIVHNHFIDVFSTCILFDGPKDELSFLEPHSINSSSLILINNQDQEATLQLLLESLNAGCQAFLVTTSMILFFLNQHRFIQDKTLQRNAVRYLVMLIDLEDSQEILQEVLKNPASERILNTLVLLPNRDHIELITNKVAGHKKEFILIDKYFPGNSSFLHSANLFPDKWKNLELKPISLVFFEFPPYNVWKPVKEGEGFATEIDSNKTLNIELGGTEGLLARDFMKKYNFTLNVSLGDVWGKINEHGTSGTGVLGSILNHEFDFGLAAVFPWYPDILFVAFSQSIRKSSVTCLVPRPRPLDSWKIIFLPFSNSMWLATIAALIVGIYGIQLVKISTRKLKRIKHQDSSSRTILNVFAIVLMQSILIKSKETSMLMVLSCLLIFGLVIASAYSGGLASVLNVPQFEKPISSISDFVESVIGWASEEDNWIQAILEDEDEKFKNVVNKFQVLSTEELAERISKYDLAYPLEILQYGSYAFGDYINEETIKYVQRMTEDFYWAYTLSISPKDWPLMPIFDDLILQLTAFGIQAHYETIVKIEYLDQSLQLAILESNKLENPGPSKLTPNHLSGIFFLFGGGLFISVVIFLGEVSIQRINVRRRKQRRPRKRVVFRRFT